MGEHPYRNVISKTLRGTSAWAFYGNFATDLQHTFLEEHL